VAELRAMEAADVEACGEVWHDAWCAMRRRHGLPVPARTEAADRRLDRRVHHLRGTDPDGSIVAVAGGEVVGFAQALVRDDLWVLSLFGVAPASQAQGVGRALLDASLECGAGQRGLILSSRDPSAMRRYGRAGFDLHPSMTAWGVPRRDALAVPPGSVRSGSAVDFDIVDAVDLAVRGARHGRSDLDFLLSEGAELLVRDDGDGYAFVLDKPALLAATNAAAASDLLRAALACAPDGASVEVGWMTAAQQWALRVVLDAGLELAPVGPICLRSFERPPAAYLPFGAFG
jgi:GNAT superfamily N-acetyltransferase